MRDTFAIATVVLLLSGSLSAQEVDWQKAYIMGMASFADGDFKTAATSFEDAIGCDPSPRAGAIDYLPWVHLAAARHELGQEIEARLALEQANRFGVAPRTDAGQEIMEQYAGKILAVPLLEPAATQNLANYRELDKKDFTLTDQEVDAIRNQVLRRCALSTDVASNKLPWYFHYLFGQELMGAGDAQRALDSYVLGANVREDPKRGKRMYGMWYVDYLPYYRIALAHAHLGNWENAQAALEMSSAFGEFSPVDPGYEEFSRLERQISDNLGSGES